MRAVACALRVMGLLEYRVESPARLRFAGQAKQSSIHHVRPPVHIYQRFSILDALSSGRAEVILGRGSFTESFPLFGYSLEDCDDLFEEKLALSALSPAQRWRSYVGEDTFGHPLHKARP